MRENLFFFGLISAQEKTNETNWQISRTKFWTIWLQTQTFKESSLQFRSLVFGAADFFSNGKNSSGVCHLSLIRNTAFVGVKQNSATRALSYKNQLRIATLVWISTRKETLTSSTQNVWSRLQLELIARFEHPSPSVLSSCVTAPPIGFEIIICSTYF